MRTLDPLGKTVARAKESTLVKPWAGQKVVQEAKVRAPILWSPESPNLYKLITRVTTDNKLADRAHTEFGIRTVAFDANKGFLLNGHPYEVKGTCNHQDHAGVGTANRSTTCWASVAGSLLTVKAAISCTAGDWVPGSGKPSTASAAKRHLRQRRQ